EGAGILDVRLDASRDAVQAGVREPSGRQLAAPIMKLLSLVYPSNYPNFAADSIYTFNRLLLGSLAAGGELEVAVAGPPEMPRMGVGIHHRWVRLGENKFEVRLGFDWVSLRALLQSVRPDVLLVNMPEQTGALAVLLRDDLGLPTRIISYIHYV